MPTYLDIRSVSLLSEKSILCYEVSLMKRKDTATKNQKYLAILLAGTIFLSAFLIFFTAGSNTDSNKNVSTPAAENNSSTIPFSQIPGKQIHHQFNSIADGLNMSPDGVTSAEYVDLQKAKGTPMEQIVGDPKSMKFLYGADVTKLYGANYAEVRGFELHAVPEQKILTSFSPVPYKGYYLLARANSTYDIWNVVGSPVVFGHRDYVEKVIDVLAGNATSTSEFNQILSHVDPQDVLFQKVATKTNNTTDTPADQYYMDIKKLEDGSYAQTSIFLNVKPEMAKNITALQANSSERGVTYNVTTSGNITKLVISSDFTNLLNETQLLS
jgi:hypothetical protein